MNSNTILFLIVVSLVAYSLVATYLFWLMRYDLRYLDQHLKGARSDISTLATAYETLRSLLERTGKNSETLLSLLEEERKRIDRLEDKRTYKPKAQAPKATPRIPRPLLAKQTNETNDNNN